MVNDNTREYSVYISDEANTVQGSGILFYAGGDSMFVFTCAHVVENLDKIKLFILREIDASRDLYNVLARKFLQHRSFIPHSMKSKTMSSGKKCTQKILRLFRLKNQRL